MKQKLEIYNENPELVKDKADELLEKMVDLKENMIENIESLIQRDGKIEIIAEKAMQLSTVSNSYKTRSRKLKEQERRKRFCYIAVLVTIALVIVGLVLYKIFGGKSEDPKETKKEAAEAIQGFLLESWEENTGFLQQEPKESLPE